MKCYNFGLYNYMLENTCHKGKVELIKTDKFNLIIVVRKVKTPKVPFGHKKLKVDSGNPFEWESPIPPHVSFPALSGINYFSSKCQENVSVLY